MRVLAKTSLNPPMPGTFAPRLAQGLNEKLGSGTMQGADFGFTGEDVFMQLMNRVPEKGPWMAMPGKHWVIVDGFADKSKTMLKIRDPWNNDIPENGFKVFEFGRSGEMSVDTFMESWQAWGGGAVWREK